MYSYVNHDAMRDVFVPVESEHDPLVRADLITTIVNDFAQRLVAQYERTVYDMKTRGMNTGQIADALQLSERKVKALMAAHSEHTGQWNPLRRHKATEFVDISHLVQRAGTARQQSTGTSPATV